MLEILVYLKSVQTRFQPSQNGGNFKYSNNDNSRTANHFLNHSHYSKGGKTLLNSIYLVLFHSYGNKKQTMKEL